MSYDNDSYNSWGSYFDDDGYFYNHIQDDDSYLIEHPPEEIATSERVEDLTESEDDQGGDWRDGDAGSEEPILLGGRNGGQLERHACERCGCSQHLDSDGERHCFCDACHDHFDWAGARKQVALRWREIAAGRAIVMCNAEDGSASVSNTYFLFMHLYTQIANATGNEDEIGIVWDGLLEIRNKLLENTPEED